MIMLQYLLAFGDPVRKQNEQPKRKNKIYVIIIILIVLIAIAVFYRLGLLDPFVVGIRSLISLFQ